MCLFLGESTHLRHVVGAAHWIGDGRFGLVSVRALRSRSVPALPLAADETDHSK
ncbi:hypothetical protein FHX76_001195 [Lysinibacter cavernae]|uniref:Uncharacterized protein n=1 Tax=Lysinibacter cavernae TaxID=1640652 RepID=A0A7X5R0R2_9MICO|nr:hypothetical protein [Lysinibacter cavernae]